MGTVSHLGGRCPPSQMPKANFLRTMLSHNGEKFASGFYKTVFAAPRGQKHPSAVKVGKPARKLSTHTNNLAY